MPRNLDYEQVCRRELANEVARQTGLSIHQLDRLVGERLEQGQREFGDAFLAPGWDGCAEAIEEAADIIVYALLEGQRRHRDDRGGHNHLMLAAVAAAHAYLHLRQAQREH